MTESYNAMEMFRNKILSRISDGFVGGETKALIKDLLLNEQGKITKNLLLFYDVSLSYLEKSYDFRDGNILKHLKTVDLKYVNSSKLEQAITALDFNHICEAFNFDDFYEEFCSCKDFFVETNNGNILGDAGQKYCMFLGTLILLGKSQIFSN
jgi:hypothetical protein